MKETMNNLADLGEKMGADPGSWSKEPPAFDGRRKRVTRPVEYRPIEVES
jgi:hypothetical protein